MTEEPLLLWALVVKAVPGLIALAALIWLFFLTYPGLIRHDFDYWLN